MTHYGQAKLVLTVSDSEAGENKYGPNPKEVTI